MKERPILFSGEMIRGLLDGRKTQTRRVVKPQPELSERAGFVWKGYAYGLGSDHLGTQRNFAKPRCPYGQPGDRLWVRETTAEDCAGSVSFARYTADSAMVRENGNCLTPWWYSRASCPSIHMPRWASRITLEIVSVRVERLQEISEEDAIAEGGPEVHPNGTACGWFEQLWESINGPGSWAANPWVWVVEFKRVEQERLAA